MKPVLPPLLFISVTSFLPFLILLIHLLSFQLQNELGELVPHKAAHRVLLQLLHPDKYLAPVQLSIVHPPEKVLAQGAGITAADSGSDSDDEGMDNAAEGSDEEGGKQEAGPLGASKKDPALRRKELLTGGLGEALCTFCAETGAALIASQYACDIVVEVCRGGEGGVLEAVVGKDAIDAVHAQVVDAAAAVPEEGEPLLESYFGSRAVQRIVQASEEEGPAGDAAGRFVDLLWSKALKGRCAALHGTHAGRVVQAVAECGRPAAAAGAKKELKGVTVKKAAPTKAVPEKAAVSKADKKKKPAK